MKIFIIIKKESVRVPRKNHVVLGDLSLWKHLVLELSPHSIFIDTDSKEIIDDCKLEAEFRHVTAYKRKTEHIKFESGELSPVLLLINRFLDEHVDDQNEVIVTTHVTSPFITTKTILDAISYLDKGYDSVFSVVRHENHAWIRKEGQLEPVNFHPLVVQKTQDLDPIFMQSGGFFIFTKKSFKEHNNRIGLNPFLYELDSPEDIEIDNYSDLKLAKLVYKGLH